MSGEFADNIFFPAASDAESQVGASPRGRTRPTTDRHIKGTCRGRRIWVPGPAAAIISQLTLLLGHKNDGQSIDWLIDQLLPTIIAVMGTGTNSAPPISISAGWASALAPASLSANSTGMQQQPELLTPPARLPTAGRFPAEMALPPSATFRVDDFPGVDYENMPMMSPLLQPFDAYNRG